LFSARGFAVSDPGCPFCEKLASLAGLPAAEVVWQFPRSVAFLGPWQYYHGYCILVARRHATELYHLSDEDRRSYLDEMTLLARVIAECFRPAKMNYELLGNQVPHLHWHLFPRYADDPQRLQPVWRSLELAERDESERQRLQTGPLDRLAITEKLRQALTSRA
jgi:diadenosine tetraphosphate (Ap4A) HIT family hydrolase